MVAILDVTNLSTGYGGVPSLHDVSFSVAAGELLLVTGANGSGKSTLLKSLFGLIPAIEGRVAVAGSRATLHPSLSQLSHVLYVPQGGRVFRTMSVIDNLLVRCRALQMTPFGQQMFLERVFETFPVLQARQRQPAATLSGGERQMLAVAGIFSDDSRLLLLDEPSLGLTQSVLDAVYARIAKMLRSTTTAAVIVEHRLPQLSGVAVRTVVLREGRLRERDQ